VYCDDDNVCTKDKCVLGQCENTPVDCNDDDQCTTDSCYSPNGCTHVPIVDCGNSDFSANVSSLTQGSFASQITTSTVPFWVWIIVAIVIFIIILVILVVIYKKRKAAAEGTVMMNYALMEDSFEEVKPDVCEVPGPKPDACIEPGPKPDACIEPGPKPDAFKEPGPKPDACKE